MTSLATRRAAGAFLLVVPLGFSICFSLLQQLFAYPAILRQPAPDVLTQFAAGGPTLVGVWYALTLTALAFVPLTVLVQRVLSERSASPLIGLAAAFGVTAGLVQTLGFVRWPFLVPFLAQSYLTPEATEMQRVTAIGLFDAFNHYAGHGVGEHLGYLTTAVWTLLTAVVMVRTGLLSRWLGIASASWASASPRVWSSRPAGARRRDQRHQLPAVGSLAAGTGCHPAAGTVLHPACAVDAGDSKRRGVARVTCDSRLRLCRTRRASRSTARQSFASAGWP